MHTTIEIYSIPYKNVQIHAEHMQTREHIKNIWYIEPVPFNPNSRQQKNYNLNAPKTV